MTARHWGLAAAAAIAITACSSGAESTTPASSEVPVFTAPSTPSDPVVIADELKVAQARWGDNQPDDYSYELIVRCVACLVDGGSTVVEVEDGIVISDQVENTIFGDLPGASGSIDDVLVFIGDALELGLVADAEFDPELGYPTFFIFTTEFAERQASFEIAPTGYYYALL